MLMKLKRHFTLMSVSSPFVMRGTNQRNALSIQRKMQIIEKKLNVRFKIRIFEGQMLGNAGRS